jgi:hypothetical protein
MKKKIIGNVKMKKMRGKKKYNFKEAITFFLILFFSINFDALFLAFLFNKITYLNLTQLLYLNFAFSFLYVMVLAGYITFDDLKGGQNES